MRTGLLQLLDKLQVFLMEQEFFWTDFCIHLLVSYTKESMIIKDEVFNRCVVILCTIVEERPYIAIIEG